MFQGLLLCDVTSVIELHVSRELVEISFVRCTRNNESNSKRGTRVNFIQNMYIPMLRTYKIHKIHTNLIQLARYRNLSEMLNLFLLVQKMTRIK